MMNDSKGLNTGLSVKVATCCSLHSAFTRKYIVILYFINMLACAADPVVAPEEIPTGANQQQSLAYAQAVGALFLSNGMPTGCSVAFINDRYAVTAARCMEQNPFDYKILIESPADPSSPGFTLNSAITHPLWNTAELGQSRNHVTAVRARTPGYYASAPSYDIAILSLATPKTDGVYFVPLQSANVLQSVDTIYFASTVMNTSRAGRPLMITENNLTTMTSLEYSLISSTKGGGAAYVNLGGEGAALIGIASGGDGQGIMFTQVSPHVRFISDVVSGAYSANVDTNRYRIEVEGPEVNPNPVDMPETNFDCSTTSDGFCDPNCRLNMGDIDCQMMVEERTGAAFGAPCSNGLDCLSRLCLGLNEYRYVCSAFCNPYRPNDCPPGFSCIPDTEGDNVCGPTPETVMMSTGEPQDLRLFGADCTNDAQCTTRACIEHNGQRWCSQRCMNDDNCPLSYVCGPVNGGRACVPPQ